MTARELLERYVEAKDSTRPERMADIGGGPRREREPAGRSAAAPTLSVAQAARVGDWHRSTARQEQLLRFSLPISRASRCLRLAPHRRVSPC